MSIQFVFVVLAMFIFLMPALADEVHDRYFPDMQGCFLLYNMMTGAFEKEIGGDNCRQQLVACSTFKVPLAVMAFDAGLLTDENHILKWDGVKEDREELNRDHDAKSWMKYSVVWFSKRLTPQLGKERFQKYLNDFNYGNKDLEGGITNAWLIAPSDLGPALKISAYEQVEWMKKLWSDALPVSKRSMQITRDLTYLEDLPNGFKLHGKTGSNAYNENWSMRLGWFISHVGNGREEYIAVTNFKDIKPSTEKSYGGAKAKEITKRILGDQLTQ